MELRQNDPAISIRRDAGADGVILRLEGRFDQETATVLRRALQELPPRETVLLDFSRIRSFSDVAVPELTRDFETRRIKIIGLPRHQERMFRYFGWREPSRTDTGYYVPEDSAVV